MTQFIPTHKTTQEQASSETTRAFCPQNSSLEDVIREINRLLINISYKKLGNLYKLYDAIEEEHKAQVCLQVGQYKDKSVFWISMAGLGLQTLSAFAIARPQSIPPIAECINSFSPGRIFDLSRFNEANQHGIGHICNYNYNKIAETCEKILNVPIHFTDPFKQLVESVKNGNKTEAQAESERLLSHLNQKRQETSQEISKLEESLKNARERIRQEEQAREAMIR